LVRWRMLLGQALRKLGSRRRSDELNELFEKAFFSWASSQVLGSLDRASTILSWLERPQLASYLAAAAIDVWI